MLRLRVEGLVRFYWDVKSTLSRRFRIVGNFFTEILRIIIFVTSVFFTNIDLKKFNFPLQECKQLVH
jgi:hypothetical protein